MDGSNLGMAEPKPVQGSGLCEMVGTYDTGAEAVESDPRCTWQDNSRRVGAGVRDDSTESCGVVQPLCIPSV